MNLPVPWKQSIVVAAAALMALASLAVSVGISFRLQDRIAAVQTATDLRRQMMMIGTALREAEAAQRMFVITGEEAHLAPLTGARESMPGRWRSTRETADLMPDFSPDLQSLEAEAMGALTSLQTTAEVRRAEGREAGVQRVVLGQSYQKLMALHMKMDALQNELDVRIEEQTRSLARAEARGRAAGLTTGLVALALGGMGVWQWRQSLRHYRRELQLSAEKSRAEQMAQDKSDFLAAMSHEVRTPLNAILGMSEQLRDSLPPGPAVQQADAISAAGRGMLRLVNDLLDLSRMEAGRLELQRSAVPVAGEIDWVRSLFGPRAAERGIDLNVTAAADLPPVLWLDEVRFRQIVMNLAGNALKFTPPGGHVSVRLERAENSSGSELVLEVKDTGCGIAHEMQSGIFQPYVQGLSENRSSSEPGTGLGLAIVRQLVQMMHGTISLQSQPGAGATFRITLPLQLPPDTFAARPAASAPVAAVAPSTRESAFPPAEPLSAAHAARLQRILVEQYPVAVSTQSTSDVSALVTALTRLAVEADCRWLAGRTEEVRRASASFAVTALSDLLEDLPRRLAPLVASSGAAPVRRSSIPVRAMSEASSRSARECILVVDDQTTNIQTVGTLLSSMGYDVMSATSAGQALQRLSARTPDLILLDMMMPGVSGLDLCRRLQGKPQWAEIPVIFLSAAGEVPIITAALEAGAVDYVTKPFHRAELLSRIRTHLTLRAAREQLRRVAADKDELLGLIAHDFKNHLAAMQVHAELLTKNPAELSPDAVLSAAIISRESRRMARCVKELLANESAGRQALKIEAVPAAEIAAGATAAIRPLAAAKEQSVTLTLPETPLAVRADAAALRQILDNLLSNAVKFSPPGGGLALTVATAGEGAEFTVSDSGPGFSDDDIARAFKRYVRLSARPTAGETSTALGLSIVKKLTELMHGSVTIESTASGGRCTVRLPLTMGCAAA